MLSAPSTQKQQLHWATRHNKGTTLASSSSHHSSSTQQEDTASRVVLSPARHKMHNVGRFFEQLDVGADLFTDAYGNGYGQQPGQQQPQQQQRQPAFTPASTAAGGGPGSADPAAPQGQVKSPEEEALDKYWKDYVAWEKSFVDYHKRVPTAEEGKQDVPPQYLSA